MTDEQFRAGTARVKDVIEKRHIRDGDLVLLVYESHKEGSLQGVHFGTVKPGRGNSLCVSDGREFRKPTYFRDGVTLPDIHFMFVHGEFPIYADTKIYVNREEIAHGLRQIGQGWDYYARFFERTAERRDDSNVGMATSDSDNDAE